MGSVDPESGSGSRKTDDLEKREDISYLKKLDVLFRPRR